MGRQEARGVNRQRDGSLKHCHLTCSIKKEQRQMPVIRISDAVYKRLQELARDDGDTPAKVKEVIEQLIENIKQHQEEERREEMK